jgi:hypothetical protein
MGLGSIKTAYETYTKHDFSRGFQFRLIDMSGVPEYVARELLDAPFGLGGLYYMSSANLPGRALGEADIQYQGFTFRIPGAVQYEGSWTLSFRTPSDFLGRNAIERWHFDIFSDETSCGRFKIPCSNSTITFGVMDHECKINRVYQLQGVFPRSFSPIEYQVAEGMEVTTWSVDFAYQWWRPVPATNQRLFDSAGDPTIDDIYEGYTNQILSNNTTCD